MTVCVTASAQAPGIACEDVLKGLFEMVAVDHNGLPAAIAHSYLNQETLP